MSGSTSAPAVRAAANSSAPRRDADAHVEVRDGELQLTIDTRSYCVRGLDRNHSLQQLRVTVLAERDGLVHLDSLDLCKARSRASFIQAAAAELYVEEAYMHRHNLKHKILAIAEEEGVAQASYALKLLQSDGRLRIAAAGKNQGSGRQETQSYEVEGPVMMFLSTTNEQPDPELANRCLTLHVNESPAQTAAIHARQRAAYTLDSHNAAREGLTSLHANAQRLLEPLPVVIPWAEQLTFRDDQTWMRREHAKYLALIAASALLHQYQRPRRCARSPESGAGNQGVCNRCGPVSQPTRRIPRSDPRGRAAGSPPGRRSAGPNARRPAPANAPAADADRRIRHAPVARRTTASPAGPLHPA